MLESANSLEAVLLFGGLLESSTALEAQAPPDLCLFAELLKDTSLAALQVEQLLVKSNCCGGSPLRDNALRYCWSRIKLLLCIDEAFNDRRRGILAVSTLTKASLETDICIPGSSKCPYFGGHVLCMFLSINSTL